MPPGVADVVDNKATTYGFLRRLENELCRRLPRKAEVHAHLSTANESRGAHQISENEFIYTYIVPILIDTIAESDGMDRAAARSSLRGEYYGKHPDLCSGNTFRCEGHPFPKTFQKSVSGVMDAWRKGTSSYPINQPYPDLVVGKPSQLSIVFDGKYFKGNTVAAAEKALVEGIYEVAYYRGLPTGRAADRTSVWACEFGCLVAYDASDTGLLRAAWESVQCKPVFWDGGNTYVLILHDAQRAMT